MPPGSSSSTSTQAMPPESSSSTSTQTQFLDCPGVVLAVPWPGCENYPFKLHSHRRLAFRVELSSCNDVVLHANNCSKHASCQRGGTNAACASCASMASETVVLNMVHRSHDDHQLPRSTCTMKYLTHTQMVQRSATHRERMRHLRLAVMNQKNKLSRLCKTVDDYKRLNLVLSQNNVPRFRALMANMIKRGASPKVARSLAAICVLSLSNRSLV